MLFYRVCRLDEAAGELSSYMTIQNGHELLQHFDQSLLPHVSAGASGAVMGLGIKYRHIK
jgi:hypothetical protein